MESCAPNGCRLHCFLDRRARRSGPDETAPMLDPWSAHSTALASTAASRQALAPRPNTGPAGTNPHSRRVASGSSCPSSGRRDSPSREPAFTAGIRSGQPWPASCAFRRECVTGFTQARAMDAYPWRRAPETVLVQRSGAPPVATAPTRGIAIGKRGLDERLAIAATVGRSACIAVADAYDPPGRVAGRTLPRGFRLRAWRNWQTHGTQNPAPARVCGFDSHRSHQPRRMKRTTCRGGRRPPAYPVHMRLGVGCVGLRAAAGRPYRNVVRPPRRSSAWGCGWLGGFRDRPPMSRD